MDNIEANKGNLTTSNSADIRHAEEIKIVASYLTLTVEKELFQLEPEAMKPEHDEDGKNQEVAGRSEPIEV